MYEYLHPVHVSVALVCIPLYIERFNINNMIDEYFRSILCTGQHIEVRILMLQLCTYTHTYTEVSFNLSPIIRLNLKINYITHSSPKSQCHNFVISFEHWKLFQ